MRTLHLKKIWKNQWGIIVSLLLYAFFFLIDIILQMGIANWGLYFLPILLNFPLRQSQIYFLAGVGSALIIWGFLLSPLESFPLLAAIFNRALGVSLLWIIAIFIKRRRTLQLELQQSQRFSDIGQLATMIAHELRNPLAAIRMAAFNMERKIKKGEEGINLERHLKNISKKVEESDQIINNLLFYSRIKTPTFDKVNILDLICESIEVANARHADYSVEVKKDVNCISNLKVDGDALQLKEVFNNILNNAFDAIEKKKGTVKVASSIENNTLIVKIFDTGKGISKQDLKKIFDPFFTTKAKGIGLGLWVSNQIVTLHGGRIDVDSHKSGTIMIVSIPIEHIV